MALPNPSAGDRVLASQIQSLKNHLEGSSTYTAPYHFRQSTGNFLVTLPDNAGATSVRFNDSDNAQVFAVNSNGDVSISGTLSPSTFTFPTGATPSQTTEGQVVWDTDDDLLTVGTGAATKVIGLSRGAGLSASATQELTYDTTAAQLNVWNGSSSVAAANTNPFDLLRTQFRAARKLVGLFSAVHYSAVDGAGIYVTQNVGVGFSHGSSASSGAAIGTLTNALLEAYTASVTGTTSTDAIGSVAATASLVATTAPNKNPRMLLRWFPGASNASLASTFAGFMAGGTAPTATTSGAYLRANTTANLFFVTRQGVSETTTDLGARPTTPTSYEIWTEDAGVTWYCRNDTTAAVVATHTANVPTATVALGHVIGGISASGNLNAYNTVYCMVESNTVA